MYGEIGPANVSFPGFPESSKYACKLGVTCPVAAGTEVTEKVPVPVASSDPNVGCLIIVKIIMKIFFLPNLIDKPDCSVDT